MLRDYLLTVALMTIGSGLIFFFKGVWEVNATPDTFQFSHFVEGNLQRIWLLAIGLVFLSLGLYLDPVGLTTIFENFPVGLKLASPLVLGSALAGLIFIVPRKEVPATTPDAIQED